MPIQRRFRTILTARLILEYREHTLYLARTKSNGSGFTLPGGKIEGEEFAKQALVREALEEAGIIITEKALKLVHVTHKRLHSTTEIIFFFHAKKWSGDISVREPEKFKDVVWLPNDEPPKTLTPVIRMAMQKIENGKIFSQFPAKEKKKEKVIDIAKLVQKEKPKAKSKPKAKIKNSKNKGSIPPPEAPLPNEKQ